MKIKLTDRIRAALRIALGFFCLWSAYFKIENLDIDHTPLTGILILSFGGVALTLFGEATRILKKNQQPPIQ